MAGQLALPIHRGQLFAQQISSQYFHPRANACASMRVPSHHQEWAWLSTMVSASPLLSSCFCHLSLHCSQSKQEFEGKKFLNMFMLHLVCHMFLAPFYACAHFLACGVFWLRLNCAADAVR